MTVGKASGLRYGLFVLTYLLPFLAHGQFSTQSGFVREAVSGEALPGVAVVCGQQKTGVITNAYGYYSLRISQSTSDSASIAFRLVGYTPVVQSVSTRQSATLNVTLPLAVQQLNEVQVRATAEALSQPMSTIALPMQQIRQTAALLGEKDVIKVLQLLPGVQKGNEGQTGLYVRGGGPDQNLLILDEAIVYNANHLFGFFSVFNTDALRNVELIKGGFPARYGGRLSSVVNMQMKEGARDKIHGEGGIGLIASRLTLEGPLFKKKGSFLVAARRTYADLLWKTLDSSLPAIFFYDLNAKINYDLGPRNRLFFSSYIGRDNANLEDPISDGGVARSGFNWGNFTATLRWNHLASERLFINTSALISQYNFTVFQDEQQLRSPVRFYNEFGSGIRDFTLKSDADWLPSNRLSLRFGVVLTSHRFTPRALSVRNIGLDTLSSQQTVIDALEGGLYSEATLQATDRLRLNMGIRLSLFSVEKTTYLRPEPRLSMGYQLPNQWVMKASYTLMNQYTHLLSNSGLGLPTDLWVPTTAQLKPQSSHQIAWGITKELSSKNLVLSAEGYYKTMQNLVGYREGATFTLIEPGAEPGQVGQTNWEDNVTTGRGWSYGLELFAHRKSGQLNGWVGYTLSWTRHQFAELNRGLPFFARYDRRHDLSIVASYQLRPRLSVSATWYTAPVMP